MSRIKNQSGFKRSIFPDLSCFYVYIEGWLSKMSKKGYHLVSKNGWLWTFERKDAFENKYFLYLKRWKGKDCSRIADEISFFYGKEKTILKKVNGSFSRIIEVDISKIDDNMAQYYKKRNYICMKVSRENFLVLLLFLPIVIFSEIFSIFAFVYTAIVIFFGVLFALNCMQYKR